MSQAIVLASILMSAPVMSWVQDPLARASGEVSASVAPATFEGLAFRSDGSPAEGALVELSSGGSGQVGVDGSFTLTDAVPLLASSVDLTITSGSESAHRKLSVLHFQSTWSGVLILGTADSCTFRYKPQFGPTPGTSDTIHAVALFGPRAKKHLHVGGSFASAGGQEARHIAMWTGKAWRPLGGGIGGEVRALQAFDDGSGPALYVGGSFSFVDGAYPAVSLPARNVARWDGVSWSEVGAGLDGSVLALALFDDGSGLALYAGGSFTGPGGNPWNLAKWDGSGWSVVGGGVAGEVRALQVFDDGTGKALFVGGQLTQAGGNPVSHLARWDGASWSDAGGGVSAPPAFSDPGIRALEVYDDGSGRRLYAGGEFTAAAGTPAKNIACWDGTSWSALAQGVDNAVRALETFGAGSGSSLYVGGGFNNAGGAQAFRLASWDGYGWSPVGGGVTGTVYALGVANLGGARRLIVAGTLGLVDQANAVLAPPLRVRRVAAWSGTSWSALGSGLDDTVTSALAFDDGSGNALYVSGPTTAGGKPMSHVTRWDGTEWDSVGAGFDAPPNAFVVHDDGSGESLYAVGDFTESGDTSLHGVARWDGASWQDVGGGCPLRYRPRRRHFRRRGRRGSLRWGDFLRDPVLLSHQRSALGRSLMVRADGLRIFAPRVRQQPVRLRRWQW